MFQFHYFGYILLKQIQVNHNIRIKILYCNTFKNIINLLNQYFFNRQFLSFQIIN